MASQPFRRTARIPKPSTLYQTSWRRSNNNLDFPFLSSSDDEAFLDALKTTTTTTTTGYVASSLGGNRVQFIDDGNFDDADAFAQVKPSGEESERGPESELLLSRAEETSETSVSSDDGPEICTVCGGGHDPKYLMQCSGCASWIHLQCFNDRFNTTLTKVPRGDIICTSQKECGRKFDDLIRRGLIHLEAGFPDAQSSSSDDELVGSWNNVKSRDGEFGSVMERASINLIDLRASSPVTYASMRSWCENLLGISKKDYLAIVDALVVVLNSAGIEPDKQVERILRANAPPISIRRCLRACVPSQIHAVTLTHVVAKENVEACFEMSYRDVIDAAFDLHRMASIRNRGPCYEWNSPRCSAGRMPLITSLVEAFAATYGFDPRDPSNVTIPVGFYQDDSCSKSGNASYCPLWMTSALLDPDVRALEGSDAHCLISLLPVAASVDYRFKTDSKLKGTRSQARMIRPTKQERERAVAELRKLATEEILASMKAVEENGRQYYVDGRIVNVRVLILWFAADMKERRMLLDLRRNVYHCSRCYAFNGKSGSAETSRGARTLKKDAIIRNDFSKGRAELRNNKPKGKKLSKMVSAATEFKEEFGHLGINLKDDCPFTRKAKCEVFTMNGPYELFNMDALHCKDGIVLYYMDFLEARLGDSFVRETQRFGNEYLKTGRFSMHVMEKGIESFHFVPLALAFGDFDQSISTEERSELVHGSCTLLYILGLLTDPAPGYVLAEFDAATKEFEMHLNRLLEVIGPGHKTTTKMHELAAHAVEQMHTMGLLRAISTKLFETFHLEIRKVYERSSKRFSDGSAFREVLEAFMYRSVILETEAKLKMPTESFNLPPSHPWVARPRFEIHNADKRLSFRRMFRRNYRTVVETVFQKNTNEDMDVQFASSSGFGSTLRMWLHCDLRNRSASLEVIAVVPGTSQGHFYSGGSFNVLAYADNNAASDESDAWTKCSVAGCKAHYHDPDCQLFCSSVRDTHTKFGLPLIFLDTFAYILPCHEVATEKSSIPRNKAIVEVDFDLTTASVVSFSDVRGVCMLKPHHDRLQFGNRGFVFKMRDVFGFQGL